MTAASFDRARGWIAEANLIVAFSGAGLSTESGIPTFRDAQTGGFWEKYDPVALASPQGFAADRRLVIEWYAYRTRLIAAAQPNPAHRALATYEAAHPGGLANVTQNIDGLLQRAGGSTVHELHGTLFRDRCHAPHCSHTAEAKIYEEGAEVPLVDCPQCGNWMRPDVVWFGEMLPSDVWWEAEQACLRCEVLLCIGTSGSVYPAAGLVQLAKWTGSRVIQVNPNPSELDDLSDATFLAPAGEAVPQLLRAD
ncbi:MAG: NAD-dependent deacetylase [Phycisphaerales bacterium JB038]